MAQERVVMGRVLDPNDMPFDGITVYAVGSSESTVTSRGGDFEFAVPSYTTYVEVAEEGYITTRVELDGSYIIIRLKQDKKSKDAKAKAERNAEEKTRLAEEKRIEAERNAEETARLAEEKRIEAERNAEEEAVELAHDKQNVDVAPADVAVIDDSVYVAYDADQTGGMRGVVVSRDSRRWRSHQCHNQ